MDSKFAFASSPMSSNSIPVTTRTNTAPSPETKPTTRLCGCATQVEQALVDMAVMGATIAGYDSSISI